MRCFQVDMLLHSCLVSNSLGSSCEATMPESSCRLVSRNTFDFTELSDRCSFEIADTSLFLMVLLDYLPKARMLEFELLTELVFISR
jgi:hypothetical protein